MTLNFLLTSDWSEKCMSFEERTVTSKLFVSATGLLRGFQACR